MDFRPGSLEYVIKRGEIVDERWQLAPRSRNRVAREGPENEMG